MTASSSPAQHRFWQRLRFLGRWEGPLGQLRRRPKQVAAICLFCLLLISAAGYAIGVQVWAQHHWRSARQAIQDFDFAKAQGHLRSCLEAWPSSAETHFLLARTSRRAGDLATARTHLKKAEELRWNTEATDLEYVLMQAQTGVLRPAESTLLGFLKAGHAEEKLLLEALVTGYLQINRAREAHFWATSWMERYPDDWQPWYLRGVALELGYRLPLALEDLKRAVAMKPDYPPIRNVLGKLLLRAGLYADALQHYEVYRQARPDQQEAVIGVARCLRALRQSEKAKPLLEGWLARPNGQGHWNIYLLLGQVEVDLNRLPQALDWLRRAEALAPKELDVNQELNVVLRQLGQVEEAEKYREKKEEIERDVRRSEKLAREVVDRPHDLSLRHEAGSILLRLDRDQEALRWLLNVLQEDPNHRPTHLSLAEYYRKNGDQRQAEVHRRRAEGAE